MADSELHVALGLAIIGATVLPFSRAAFAQVRDPAAAEKLFDDGHAALEAGNLTTACAKLEESEHIDPAPGTLFFWADCEAKRGRVATAWGLFRELEEKLPDSDARKPGVIAQRIDLEKRIPHLTIRLPPDAPKDASVKRDGVSVGAASLGTPVPTDPGKHTILVEAPGYLPRETPVELKLSESRQIVALVGALAPQTANASGGPPAKPTLRMPIGIATTAVGGATLVAGIFVGVGGRIHYNQSNDHCDKNNFCDARGIEIRNGARSIGNVGTALVVIGATTGAVGSIIVFTAPRAEGGFASTPTVKLAMGPSGAFLQGTFQ